MGVPEAAVREALVNALVHRDLSGGARGTPVQIHLFPDRLTILNPGGLFGPVTTDHLGEAGVSATRNQVLMKVLEDTLVPEEGRLVCENRGSGIAAMLAALNYAGLPAARFVDRIGSFEVTFPALVATEPRVAMRVAPRAPRQRADRRPEILDLLRHGELTRSQIAQALGISDGATRRWLHILREEGQKELTTSARSKHARYRTRAVSGSSTSDQDS
jgi:ATP-dependent DNA helicase RecG